MYSILLSPSAAKDYKKITKDVLTKINKAIDSLSINPRSLGYKKLRNRDAFRIRVGDYRIIYEIHDREIIVMVIRIRHRKVVYRKL